jgi:hypothetical protein
MSVHDLRVLIETAIPAWVPIVVVLLLLAVIAGVSGWLKDDEEK